MKINLKELVLRFKSKYEAAQIMGVSPQFINTVFNSKSEYYSDENGNIEIVRTANVKINIEALKLKEQGK